MKTETYIRLAELGIALSSTYMVAITLLQTSGWSKLSPYLQNLLGPLFYTFGLDPAYLDFILLGLIMYLSFSFWRRGDEAGFGRLFSLNMLLLFPAVLDFSMFNWVNLILPYDPEPLVSGLWVFGVGLLLQSTYLALRYTVRFRNLRVKLVERGAEMYDVDQISKGQMIYLGQLVLGTSFISLTVYYLIPIMQDLFAINALNIPYPHIVIGFTCTLLIAASIILYLRGWGKTTEAREITTQINKDLPNNLDIKNQ